MAKQKTTPPNNQKSRSKKSIFLKVLIGWVLLSLFIQLMAMPSPEQSNHKTQNDEKSLPKNVQYVLACRSEIKALATHPSTVDFDFIHDVKEVGEYHYVLQNFNTKNSYNLEITYSALCKLEKDGTVVDVTISEESS